MPKKASPRLRNAAEKLSLGIDSGDIIEVFSTSGESIIIIKRQGYRRVAAQQPDYIKHTVYPIYPNTQIEIVDDAIRISMGGDMSNVTGALGVLYKKDVPGYLLHHVSMSDYEHKITEENEWWKKMPQTMLVKTCETSLIRMAYPEMFAGVYFEEEEPEKIVSERKDVIVFLRKNIKTLSGIIPQNIALDNLKIDELRELETKAKEILNASKAKHKKH